MDSLTRSHNRISADWMTAELSVAMVPTGLVRARRVPNGNAPAVAALIAPRSGRPEPGDMDARDNARPSDYLASVKWVTSMLLRYAAP